MAINQRIIELALENLKKPKRQKYMKPGHYQDFMPGKLNTDEPRSTRPYYDNVAAIMKSDYAQTGIVKEHAENKRERKARAEAQKELRAAQKLMRAARNADYSTNYRGPKDVNLRINNQYRMPKGSGWGRDRIPEVSDIGKLRPHGPLTNIRTQGHNVTVNRQVAPIFKAFLNELTGRYNYNINSIGGHNDRNIAGTSTPSLHSYGFAIDINPRLNPVQHGSNRNNLPPGISALAAKYGLQWGGDWNSYKDPMHFSVAWGGRE